MEELPDVTNQLSSGTLFVAFKEQLRKNFEQCNFPADFIDRMEPVYENIHRAIFEELQRSEKRSDSSLMQLLYRVDIQESQLKRYIGNHPGRSYFDVMAELIIKRILQKVVIKQMYRNKEGG
jgi:hypothetical protein